jgi:hypothetical protein
MFRLSCSETGIQRIQSIERVLTLANHSLILLIGEYCLDHVRKDALIFETTDIASHAFQRRIKVL